MPLLSLSLFHFLQVMPLTHFISRFKHIKQNGGFHGKNTATLGRLFGILFRIKNVDTEHSLVSGVTTRVVIVEIYNEYPF
ncbi:hypothetical protein SOASR016_09760 [Pectobacterium carotovorum subsp. carotovorum]|uniref:Uncharacterized protein n=1 Tax=Pectobacterium carotovorum subsp. carotovorum TaxID=555 RepID=A0ABQ5L3R3_PECCC|nr:hypothetical protein SOASR016_09760 [Pectobacterium carotovorum subsp. carotovorum]